MFYRLSGFHLFWHHHVSRPHRRSSVAFYRFLSHLVRHWEFWAIFLLFFLFLVAASLRTFENVPVPHIPQYVIDPPPGTSRFVPPPSPYSPPPPSRY